MRYVHHDLGSRRSGEIAEVRLRGTAANVLLLDSANFNAFRRGRRYRYVGGYYKRSPVLLPIPRNGHWHVVVHMGGYTGRVSSSATVLPGAMRPSGPSTSRLSAIADNAAGIAREPDRRQFDVFISHASEDKDPVVRPLAQQLADCGLAVWYDEFELRLGDSLRRKIDYGLANCRFGVVVLSEAFFQKNWPQYELDGLVTREITGEQVVLPIWHQITKDEIVRQSPSLADKVAVSTGVLTIDEIAAEIVDVVRPGVPT